MSNQEMSDDDSSLESNGKLTMRVMSYERLRPRHDAGELKHRTFNLNSCSPSPSNGDASKRDAANLAIVLAAAGKFKRVLKRNVSYVCADDLYATPAQRRRRKPSPKRLRRQTTVLSRGGDYLKMMMSGHNPNVTVVPESEASGSNLKVGTRVAISVRVLRLAGVKDELQTFTCEMLLHLMWEDPKMVGVDDADVNWDTAWRPRMTIVNLTTAVDDYFSPRSVSAPVLMNSKTGLVFHVMKIQGTFCNNFHLQDFPFDLQCFQLIFRSKDSYDKVCLYRMRHKSVETATAQDFAASLTHWSVQEKCIETVLIDRHSLNRPYSVYHLNMYAFRRPGFYIRKIFSVVVVTTAMTLFSFYIPLSNLGARGTFLVGILLANVTFSFIIAAILPKIGYYTQLDKFFQLSTLAPFVAMFTSAAIFYVQHEILTLCTQRVGTNKSAHLIYSMGTSAHIYSTGKSTIDSTVLDCDYYMDTWVFRIVLGGYACYWCYFFLSYQLIGQKNKRRWEQALASMH